MSIQAFAQYGPGGVNSNMEFWYMGNAGTSTTTNGAVVSSWSDQSGNGVNASQVGTGPLYSAAMANYNPELDFSNSTSGSFEVPLIFDIASGAFFNITLKTGSDVTTTQVVLDAGGLVLGLLGEGFNVYIKDGELHTNVWNLLALGGLTASHASTPINANTNYVISISKNLGGWVMYINGQAMNAAFNLSVLGSFTVDAGLGDANGNTLIGSSLIGGSISSGNGFKGLIKECVYYTTELSTSDRNKVETYMALKYGITLQSNYSSSDNTILWNSTVNSYFGNDITGLAADTNANLFQKQSYTLNDTNQLVTIGLNQIASDNTSNASNFNAGHNFIVWGHNDSTLDGISSNAELGVQSGDADYLKRSWKLIESGTIDTVLVSFQKTFVDSYFEYPDFGNFALKVADDSLFTTNVAYADLSDTLINGDSVYAGSYNFNGTKYFTLAQRNAIIWTGNEWRGGLSETIDHGPSDESGDDLKGLYIVDGDTATLVEPVHVNLAWLKTNSVLELMPGNCLVVNSSFTNNGSFFIDADATGYGQYNGPAVNATYRQHIPDNGWHLLASPFSNTTWADFSFLDDNGFINHPLSGTSLDSCTYCNLHYYDASTDNGTDIGFGASNAYGSWRSSSNESEAFTADKGWILYLDGFYGFAEAPWTIELNGTFNDGAVNQTVNENNGGWNLVANPYPSALNWDAVDDHLVANGMALGYHIWDEANANFAVYANGVGTLGATNNIAPMQGFYVQTAVEGGRDSLNIYHTLTLDNPHRSTDCSTSNIFYKTQNINHIRLEAKRANGKRDETVILFNNEAKLAFDVQEDVRKLFGQSGKGVSIYTAVNRAEMGITQMPFPLGHDSIFVGVKTLAGAEITLSLKEYPQSLQMYLEDRATGRFYKFEEAYTFTHIEGLNKRFILHFGSDVPIVAANESPLKTYINGQSQLVIDYGRKAVKADWQLVSLAGKVVAGGKITYNEVGPQHIDVASLPKGIYLMMYFMEGEKYVEKIAFMP